MKKLFFRRRSALSESRLFSFGAILVAVGLIIVILRIAAPSTFFILTSPVLQAGTFLNIQTGKVMSGFSNTQMLAAEREALTKENVTLSLQNQILVARVQDLTNLVGTSTLQVQGVVADVLARPPESPYDIFVVDAGISSGISIGDGVLAYGGIPIGSISSVSSHSARVTLFSSPMATTTAWVGVKRVPIILKGIGAGAFIAHISRGVDIAIGNAVFVSGKGIRPIGIVKRIDAVSAAVTETLRIRPVVNLFSITSVEIIHSKMP